jgi:hypothetical protein
MASSVDAELAVLAATPDRVAHIFPNRASDSTNHPVKPPNAYMPFHRVQMHLEHGLRDVFADMARQESALVAGTFMTIVLIGQTKRCFLPRYPSPYAVRPSRDIY